MKKLPITVFCWLFAVSAALYLLVPADLQSLLYSTSTDFADPSKYILGFVRLLTYQFAHASISHLFGNFFFLFPSALYLEKRLGKARFLAFYVLCGICSGVGFLAIMGADPLIPSPVTLLGASGSIFGCFIYTLILWGKDSWVGAILALCAAFYIVLPNCYGAVLSLVMPVGVAYLGHLCGGIGALFLGNFRFFSPVQDFKSRRNK